MPTCKVWARLAALAITPMAVAACSGAQASSDVEFLFYPSAAAGVNLSALTIRFTDGQRARTISASDFTTERYATPHTPRYEVGDAGSLQVEVLLTRGQGDTLTSGRVDIPLRPDWRFGVSVHVQRENPGRVCVGCAGVEAFPLREVSDAADSLYIAWGGSPAGASVTR